MHQCYQQFFFSLFIIIYGSIRAGTCTRNHQHTLSHHLFLSSISMSMEKNGGKKLRTKWWPTEQRGFDWSSSHTSIISIVKTGIADYESIFILCWCDFSPLFSSRLRWRPAGECKHHRRVLVCPCVCFLCCFIPFWSYLRLSWLA